MGILSLEQAEHRRRSAYCQAVYPSRELAK
jgi:hypothetical protein